VLLEKNCHPSIFVMSIYPTSFHDSCLGADFETRLFPAWPSEQKLAITLEPSIRQLQSLFRRYRGRPRPPTSVFDSREYDGQVVVGVGVVGSISISRPLSRNELGYAKKAIRVRDLEEGQWLHALDIVHRDEWCNHRTPTNAVDSSQT